MSLVDTAKPSCSKDVVLHDVEVTIDNEGWTSHKLPSLLLSFWKVPSNRSQERCQPFRFNYSRSIDWNLCNVCQSFGFIRVESINEVSLSH